MARIGRPPNYVRDENGVEVFGLSKTPNDGPGPFRYFGKVNGKKEWFGFDEKLAIARFHEATDSDAKRTAKFVERINKINAQYARGEPSYRDDEEYIQQFDEENWRRGNASRIRKWLLGDPKGAAKQIDIPELAHIHALKPLEPSPTLQSFLDLYLAKKGFRTAHEHSVSTLFWDHFMDIVQVKTVRELSKKIVSEYADKTLAEYKRKDKKKKSQTWVKHRFGKVKSVLRFALDRSDESDMADITRAISYCQMFELPETPEANPRPIDPTDFRKLLDAADDLDAAIMLFALNCCMYAEEVKYTKKEWIKGNALKGYRYKKGNIPRIAILWGRTTEALAKLPEHDEETVFDITTRQIQRRFKKLREKVGLNHVEFRHIRDGSYTKMEDVSVGNAAEMVAGHKTGIKDRYVLRHPEKATDVCAAVEQHYFPPPKP